MSDLDITISIDPSKAVPGAKQVTAAISETEKAATDAKAAVAALAKTVVSLPPPPPAVASAWKRASDAIKEMGFNAKEMKNKLNELGKQASFGLIQQGVQKANDALKDFGLSLGTTGAAIGFQLAGPLGAAAGAAGELIGMKLADWASESDRAAQAAADSYINWMKVMTAWEDGVEAGSKAMREHIKVQNEANAAIGGVAKVLAVSTAAYDAARQSVLSYSLALVQLQNEKLRALAAGGTTFTTVDDVKTQRGLRDAQLAMTAATYSYGGVLSDIIGKENHRKDAIADANAALKAGAITQQQYNEYMKQFATQADAATLAMRKLISEEAKLRNSTSTIDTRVDVTSGFKVPEYKSDAGVDAAMRTTTAKAPIYEATEATKAWNLELAKTLDTSREINDVIGAQLVSGVQTLFGAITDAASGADVAWGETLKNLASGFAQAILQAQLLKLLTGSASGAAGAGVHGGYGGLLGIFGGATGFDYVASSSRRQLPGFATGGDMYTRGGGSTDSMLAMFRVTPGESIHVRTPEQRREAAQAQGGGRGLRVVQVSADPRALAPMPGDDDTVMLEWASRNRDKLRRLIQ